MKEERHENPFICGEVITDPAGFVDRKEELRSLERDLLDGQKTFLLSPRRFGKSSLVSVVFQRLKAQHKLHTAIISVNNYASYTQFLEGFAGQVIKAAGSYDTVRTWIGKFWAAVNPEVVSDPHSGEIRLSFGRRKVENSPIPEEVFRLPETLSHNGKFRMAICLDEFQQIETFGGVTVENCLRNAVQCQRQVGYIFAGSQPSVMAQAVSPKRPFYKAGPVRFLKKIDKAEWETVIPRGFRREGKLLTTAGLHQLLNLAELVPADVQRLAHELWDHAQLTGTETLGVQEVEKVAEEVVQMDAPLYEHRWERLPQGQRSVLQTLAAGHTSRLHGEEVRQKYRLGSPSTVQKSLKQLERDDIIDREKGGYFFLEPFFAAWIRRIMA